MNKNKALRLALGALKDFSVVDKQAFEATVAIKAALETEEHEWEGLTEEEFVYFCSFVDHDTLSQIENILRDKNELCSN
jgi:hypothetical protein